MKVLALVLCLLGLAMGRAEAAITDAVVQSVAQDARAAVEAETGVKFDPIPTVVIASRDELENVLKVELLPQVRLLHPEAPRSEDQASAATMAHTFSGFLLGKYDPAGHRVLIMAANFDAMAKLLSNPRIESEDYLRVALTHELVHAMDEQQYHVVTGLASAPDATGLEIRSALLEGHAQFVTQRILEKTHEGDLFLEFEKMITAVPPGMGEGEAYMARLLASSFTFSYIEGRRFFVGLAQSDPDRPYVRDVFTNPPQTKSVILHPELYYHPGPAMGAVVDLKQLWQRVEATRAEWTPHLVALDESKLRAASGDFVDAASQDAVFRHVVQCHVLVLAAPDGKRSRNLGIYQMDSEKAADDCYQLNVNVVHIKDERMASGDIRITSHEYRPVKLDGVRSGLMAVKTVQAGPMSIQVQDVLLCQGRYVVELQHVGEIPPDTEVTDLEHTICRALAEQP